MFFQIDFGDTLPIYDQVVRQIKFAVAGGVLKEGELVPSVRELARELTINPNTVARAYRRLQDDGVLDVGSRHGPGGRRRRGQSLPRGAGRTDPRAVGTGVRRGQAEPDRSAQAARVGGTAVGEQVPVHERARTLSPTPGRARARSEWESRAPTPLPKGEGRIEQEKSCRPSSGSTN